MADKYRTSTEFYNNFIKLTDSEKENFSRVCNKILDKNFIIRIRESDREDFFFVLSHLTLFQSYFSLMDFTITHYEADQIIALETDKDRNRTRLKRIDTIMLLIMRILYQEKAKEATQLNRIMVSIGEIHDQIEKTGSIKGKISKTDLLTTLRNLKRFSIIDFLSTNLLKDDTKIELYPSLLRVVNIDDLNALEAQLSAYETGGDDDEDVDED